MIEINSSNELLQIGNIKNGICPNCKNRDKLEYKIFGGVIRIIFIPIIPNRRTIKIYCNSCLKEFNVKNLDHNSKQTFKYGKNIKPIKYPLWQFSGSIILISILSFAIYTGIEMKKLEKNYIQEPKKNDVYKINSNGDYSTLKVNDITQDSILILLNKFTLNSYKGLDEININENYLTKKSFSRKEIIKMYNDNLIYEIIRN